MIIVDMGEMLLSINVMRCGWKKGIIFSERLFCSSIANSTCVVSDKTNLTKFVGIFYLNMLNAD